jgi:hypothetical protein
VQKVIVLPKDDQEVEELMLEEVEVFKVGGPAHASVTLSGPILDLRLLRSRR